MKIVMVKTCTKKDCPHDGAAQPVTEFSRRSSSKDGLGSWCKTCNRKSQKLYWQKPETKEREWRRRHKPEVKKRHREYMHRPEMKEKRRRYHLSLYSVTLEWYEMRLAEQNQRCGICEREFLDFKKKPCVDHDHRCCPTGRSCGKCVRGLLCVICNFRLCENIECTPQQLTVAEKRYLKRYKVSFTKEPMEIVPQFDLFSVMAVCD